VRRCARSGKARGKKRAHARRALPLPPGKKKTHAAAHTPLSSFKRHPKQSPQTTTTTTAEEYAARLEYVAMALRAWGQSEAFVRGLAATKEKPRVGKAAAIMLEGVSEERLREFVSF
jgi:hypothetical protein